MNALELKQLQKKYKNGPEAVKKIDLTVKQGDFFGLLGPNGAGKTTAIGIVTSLINKDSGEVSIFGFDLDKQNNMVKKHIGLVPQEMNFNIFEKVQDILVQQAGYYGISRTDALANSEKYLKKLGLWEKRDQPSRNLSGGMKRRLMIARALVHNPKLLILDEPTAGVDVELRRDMWNFLTDLNKSGTTIILTTHYLEEAELLCDRIAIINHGKIIANASKDKLIKKLEQEIFVLDLDGPLEKGKDQVNFRIKKISPATIEVELRKEHDLNSVFQYLEKKKVKVISMKNKTNRLEELFLKLTKK